MVFHHNNLLNKVFPSFKSIIAIENILKINHDFSTPNLSITFKIVSCVNRFPVLVYKLFNSQNFMIINFSIKSNNISFAIDNMGCLPLR